MSPGIKLPHFHLLDYCSYSASMLHWWWCENWTESSERPTSRLSLLIIWIFPSSGRMTKKSIWVARVEPFCYHSFTSPTLCRPRPTVSGIASGGNCRNGQKLLRFFFLNCPSSFDGNCPGPCLVKLINCCVFAHRPAHFWNNGLKHDLARSRFQLRP